MAGLTFDAGALIAIERNDRYVATLLSTAVANDVAIVVPAGVIGQVWRDGRRQVRLARFLAASTVSVEPLDDRLAREAGALCGLRGSSDVIDASVVLSARKRGDRIVSSDAEDLLRLDPDATIVRV